ncbi:MULTISPECIES: GNAT family N-acetyltransferase [Nocardiopsis]|uniref:GCN5-related N-acetyltransferase n=1 Tax=Nocardiopsis dassonvillei (strain ATCC 23218 / DSM 43111 / CIP 107115 / JCM 7437 / KCTC 9190 / NBRC 14626 / NCTC 10488 / NRRL B-5397 / IMRU 509) TaxID=446468 RepID=D7B4E7_NOCDD|nr:GNAT family N-acetyltransferase [Nocardiopsis dassonvillei]ADH68942.1 GCN5-related N-acetyltransferase [Nocardiopsis dassonvillei subsp. dassonvillei DSM 43111]NKY81139.1 GNAT family N-acetyltransferase [Nocardiopsis dassonvillei]VEI89452.1 aminoalkylphosphonic acid N-acetyltransferase [Nocardiopsis dassonvillei]
MNEGITINRARAEDVAAIVAMLADDELGARREDPGNPAPYLAAFEVIDADPHQFLAVARRGDRVVGTLQLTFLPGLSHRGATRAQVEAVRVHSDVRGGGLGTDLLAWAEEEARRRGAAMLQLTSDASREDAHRFYERLGYTASHVGFKKRLG